MATRQRPSTSRPQSLARPLYEDLQPTVEKKENQEANFLHIQLPGFAKEQINITYVHASRTLKVSGERPSDVGGNRWIRFRQEYSVPDNCEVERLQGKFDQGTLTITMPKKFVTQVSSKEVVTTQEETDAVPSKKAVAEPKPGKAQDVTAEISAPSTREAEARDKVSAAASVPGAAKGPAEFKPRNGQKETSDQRAIDSRKPAADDMGMRTATSPKGPEPLRESKPQKDQEDIVQKPALTAGKPHIGHEEKPTLKVVPRKQTEEKPQMGQEENEEKPMLKLVPGKQTEEKPQNGRELTEPKFKIATAPRKQQDENPQQLHEDDVKQKTTLAAVPKKQTDEKIEGTKAEVAEKEGALKKEVKGADGMPSESRKPENDAEKFVIRQLRAKKELEKAGEGSAQKTQEKQRENTDKAAVGDEGNRRENMAHTKGKGMKTVAATASQATSRIADGKRDDEDKSLLVNMGIAALVIAALGAFVSYKFTSSGKS